MKVEIGKRKSKNSSTNEVYYLDESDFNPCKSFFLEHPLLIPESISEIKIKGLLEYTKVIRYVLFISDSLLKVDGVLDIDLFNLPFDSKSSPFRNRASIMNEISLTFKHRLLLINRFDSDLVHRYEFKKISQKLPAFDNIESWSFGIVSDGRKNNRIINLISQISNFKISNYEILICGPSPSSSLPSNVKVLNDLELYSDIRIPISKKKNLIIENAIYNNLVILHDRFSFPLNWYEKIKTHGNYFDGLCIKILDEDTKQNRVQDWLRLSNNPFEFKKIFPIRFLLNYNEWSPSWNINGGFLIIKKHLLQNIKLNPNLNWGEMEDLDMCKRLNLDGFCLTLFTDAEIYTQTQRLTTSKRKSGMNSILHSFKYILFLIVSHFLRKRKFRKYLSQIN